MLAGPQTIDALFDASVDADPTRPFVTFYDQSAGERVELSGATTRNWVDKTANLLLDVLGATSGSRVSLALPTHWQSLVWVLACWRIGAIVDPDPNASADVAVIGPHDEDDGGLPTAAEVVATSLHPLGARFERSLPIGVTDYGAEVFAQADTVTTGVAPSADTPAWQERSLLDHGAMIERGRAAVRRLGLGTGARLLTDANPATLDGAVTSVMAPLLVLGSVVLVRHHDPTSLLALGASERVDVTMLGTPSAGPAAP